MTPEETPVLSPTVLRNAVVAMRDAKLPSPSHTGSAGSFFKNPVVSPTLHAAMEKETGMPVPGHILPTGNIKLSAAWLIDRSGCKSLSVGGAGVWPTQPLVIVNADGHATGPEVVELENEIRRKVKDTFGVDLTPEVVHL